MQLRFYVFCTVPVCVLIWGGTGVDNRMQPGSKTVAAASSRGQASRLQITVALLPSDFLEPSSPTSQDFMTLLRLGPPRDPYRAGPPYNKHSVILTLVVLFSQRDSNKLTNFHGVQQSVHRAHNEPLTLLYKHKAFQALITHA